VKKRPLINRPFPRIDLWVIWLAALSLRLLYLWLTTIQFGFDKLTKCAPDTFLYRAIATHFLTGTGDVTDYLLKGGPGYGMMLAVIRWLFGDNLLWPILANVLLGSLAPVAIYLLAHLLIRSRAVSLIAGSICALSFTSLSMSNSILTDQPFFTIHAFTLVAFVWGFQTGKTKWFLIAGFLAGIATLIRSSGEFWPWIFLLIACAIPMQPAFRSRWEMIRRASVTPLIMLIFILGWSARNYNETGIFTFNTNGLYALRGYLLNQAVCEHTPGCVWKDQGLAWSIEDGDKTAPPSVAYARAKARVKSIIQEHPDWVMQTYFTVLTDNVRNMNNFMYQHLPAFRPFTIFVYDQLKRWFWVVLIFLSLAGVVRLLIVGNQLAAYLLGAGYGYFTLVAGLSMFQGSRLHYPAEMAAAILIAYSLVELGRAMRRRVAITRMSRWAAVLCLASLATLSGCAKSDGPGLAIPWDSAKTETQSIIELQLKSLANMNADPKKAAEYFDPMDGDSIELFVTARGEKVYHPVSLCHRCLQFIAIHTRTGDSLLLHRAEKYAKKLIEISKDYHGAIFVPYEFDYSVHQMKRLTLRAPFYSGMAQGELLSVMTRLYLVTGKPEYRDDAERLFESLTRIQGTDDPWVARIDTSGYFWLEEYTIPDGLDQTLNGYVAAVYGLYDYWLMSKDPRAKRMWDQCLTTIKHYLPEYRRVGTTSLYCLGHREPASADYHALHISMCRELTRLSGDPFFAEMAEQFYADSRK
jgi:4-amino-4-deoxy-L-arabinose transferase-like glycosyltransferase